MFGMALEVGHRELEPGTVIIAMSGKIMLGRESQQLETLIPELLAQGFRRFIFDMSGVAQIDSTGIGRFISAYNTITGAGGKMRIAGATRYVRDGFRVTRLDLVIQFSDDVEAARSAMC
jgi:anti-anti-sigma factor